MKKASVLEWLTAIATIIGIGLVLGQLSQANQHKKWDNYNTMNNVYRQMYNQLQTDKYKTLRESNCADFVSLTYHEKAWIRSYYNLYAEEFDLDKAKLLPELMMNETISRGFKLNLRQHPSIAEGFDALLSEGAFDKKSAFSVHVQEELNSAGPINKCASSKTHMQDTEPSKK